MIEQRLLKGIIDERDFELVHVEARRQRLSLTDEDSAQAMFRRSLFLDLARTTDDRMPQAELINRLLFPVEHERVGDYGAFMRRATQDNYIEGGQGVRSQSSSTGRREDYGKLSGGEAVSALRGLIRRATYNSGFPVEVLTQTSSHVPDTVPQNLGRDGDSFHTEGAIALSMTWPELEQTRERLKEIRQRLKVQVWLPCHSEPGVADMNVDYAANAVDPSRVLCVNTNRVENTDVRMTQHYLGRSAKRYPEVTFGLQDLVLSCVDWKRVSTLFHIPLDKAGRPEAQAKGITLLALALIAEARNDLRDGYVAFHDTDIVNPREYLALDYLTVPFLAKQLGIHNDNPLSVYIARTGSGRNNQPIHSALNAIVAEPGGDKRKTARELALNVSLAPWPITGERILRADIVRRLPWTNDMTIESQINVMLAGEAATLGALATAHVMNPHPKLECADVSVEREWRMMNYCAHHHRLVIEHCNTLGKVLGDWTPDDIGHFNQQTSIRVITGIITNDAGQTGSIAYATRPAYMLPSVEMLAGLNVVDLAAVRAEVDRSRSILHQSAR